MKAVTTKTDNLSQAVGTSDVVRFKQEISDKYEELRDKAASRVSRAQQDVDEHVTYQNMLITFTEWMKTGRERLAMCADTYGDKLTMANRKEIVKV